MTNTLPEHKDDLLMAIERFELVAKATHDVIWDWDLQQGTVWWSNGMENVFGYRAGEIELGPDSWYDRLHPDDQERVITKIHKVIDRGETNWSDFYRFRRANGTYADVHDRGYTIQHDGKPVRMVGSMMDISEQLMADKAREESEESLKQAIQAAQLGTWSLNPSDKIALFNDRCKELYGYPSDTEMHYSSLIEFIHPDDRQRVVDAIARALDPAYRHTYDVRYRVIGASDQKLRWLHCTGQAYFDSADKPFRFSGISREITSEVTSQEKIAWADQQAAMTIEGSGAGSFMVTLATNEIIYSPTMARIITGVDDINLTRNVLLASLHPDDVVIRDRAYAEAADNGELRYEARFVWRNGSVHWVRVLGRYLYDSAGKALTLSGIVMDITDRIESEQRLKVNEEHLRTLIEQAPVATALYVGKDMIVDIPNEAMLKVWGKGRSVIGKRLSDALPELAEQPFLDILNQIYRTGEAHSERGARADLVVDGRLQTFYFDYTYKPFKNANGDVYAILNMAVDVTEQVVSRQELERSEERYRQLASELETRVRQRTDELHQANIELVNSNNNLQQFAYAASHDMQEPLRKIQSFGSRLQSTYADKLDENGKYMLNRIQDASKRMSAMIDDLLAYSRLTTREGEFGGVRMGEIVASVLADLEISIQEQKTEIFVEDLPEVWGNAHQLTQLMQNLISNAIKYRLPEQASTIRISYRNVENAERDTLPKLLSEHRYIRLEVTDNGIGFDEIYLDRIFQMFQRLHGRSEFSGSGIGLALCKKVVQNHHGYITAQSRPGEGSTFIVYLPQPL